MPLTSAKAFDKEISKATTEGICSFAKGNGRTKTIFAALLAYENSLSLNQAEAQKAAYLFQVTKECKAWCLAKAGEVKGNTPARRRIIERVSNEAYAELKNSPLVGQALAGFNRAKGSGRTFGATPLKGVYAHEGAAYQQFKALGQFHDPRAIRFAPSATTMGQQAPQIDRVKPNGQLKDFTFAEYMQLDVLLNRQYKVLYLNKIQRLEFMVGVDRRQRKLVKATDDSPYDMPGSTVNDDLGQGDNPQHDSQMYACDKYGNLFVFKADVQGQRNGAVQQVNHSTFCAGKDVLCAGTISIKGGQLRGISNLSGHYLPDTKQLTDLLKKLVDDGILIDGVLVLDRSPQRAGNSYTEGIRYLAGRYGEFRLNQGQAFLENRMT